MWPLISQYIHIQLRENKSYIHVKNLKHMTIARIIFYHSIKYFFRIFVICHGFYKHWYYNFFFTFLFTSSASQKLVNI